MSKKSSTPLGDHPWVIAVVVLSGICAVLVGCITIFIFVTGRENIPEAVQQGPSEQEQVLEEAGVVQPKRSSPEDAAEAAFEIWANKTNTPYKDVVYSLINNDGTFATIHIDAWFRKSAKSDWVEHETEIECKNVSDNWECVTWINFEEVYVPPPADFEGFLTNVWVGEKAMEPATQMYEHQKEPKDGWKLVVLELVIENVSGGWTWVNDSVVSNLPPIQGYLIDSEGYERELRIKPRPFGTHQDTEFPIPPSFRVSMLAQAEIPENFEPDKVMLQLPGSTTPIELDAKKPVPVKMPFDSTPSRFMMNVGDSFSFSNDLTATVIDLEITNKVQYGLKASPDSTGVFVTMEFENNGGNDAKVADPSVELRAIDNHGHYTGEGNYTVGDKFDSGVLSTNYYGNVIPPGRKDTGKKVLAPFFHSIDEIDTVWVILIVKIGDEVEGGIFRVEK